MLAVIISSVMVLLFMGVLSYLWLKPVFAARNGRQVDVRVRSCTMKEIPRGNGFQERMYYEVIVDFFDLNGEVLVRSFQSRTPYMQDDVVRCRYLDKSDFLLPEMATEIQTRAKYKVLLLFAFFVAFIVIMASLLSGMKNEEKKEIHWSSPQTKQAYPALSHESSN